MRGRTFSREGVTWCDQGQDCTAADVTLGTAFCSVHTVSTTSLCVHEKTDPQLLRNSRQPNSFGPSGNSLEVELHCINHHCHRHQNKKSFHSFTGFYRNWRKMCEERWRVRKQRLSVDLPWGNLESCWHWLNLCWICEDFYQWPQWELCLQPMSLADLDLQTFVSVLICHWNQTVQITKKPHPQPPT